MNNENTCRFREYSEKIENKIDGIIKELHEKCTDDTVSKLSADAVEWSLASGGKRIRPVLALEFCRVCGGEPDKALPAAAALEMIHTYSLIHDDLPCMDNDDYRRGRLSCHKKFGEAFGLLAGDALLDHAAEIVTECDELSDRQKVKIIFLLARSGGIGGMIGGQVLDLYFEKEHKPDSDELLRMYSMKTGALLKCACLIGCICAEADEKAMAAAEVYAENIGLTFQIIDDILDMTETTEALGKPAGSDEKQHKTTYASLNGIEGSQKKAAECTQKAMTALEVFEDRKFLEDFTDYLLKRKN